MHTLTNMKSEGALAHWLAGIAPDGTYDLWTGAPLAEVSGYEVGGYDSKMPAPFARPGSDDFDPAAYTEAMALLARRIYRLRREWVKGLISDADPIRLGVWTDEDGYVHLDATRHRQNRGTAMTSARTNSQIAIWDWADMTSVDVKLDHQQGDRRGT